MMYDQLRTEVSYYTSSQRYDAISTPVSYYKKAPTYEIPRTSVKYHREVEDCVIRDGAKTNCKYTYPEATTVLQGASGSDCGAFVAGKLPSGALYNKAGYLPSCTPTTPLARTGACSETNTSIQNCRQNYSAVMNTVLSGKVTSTCAAFVNGRLPSGSVYTDSGYIPMCGNKIVDADKAGACNVNDGDKENCRTVYTLAPNRVTLDRVPGSGTCLAFARNRLPSGAVYADQGYEPSCSSGPTKDRSVTGTEALSRFPAAAIAAGEQYETATTTVTHEGAFTCGTPCSETSFCRTSTGTVGDNYHMCSVAAASPIVKSSFTMQPANSLAVCPSGQSRRITRAPYKTDIDRKTYVAGGLSEANQPNALSDYILTRSRDLFRDVRPIVSVFVRQSGDSLGTNGSYGEAYNRLADLFGGRKRSVLASADEYASALEDLSAVIRERLSQTIAFKVPDDLQIRKVWFRRAGVPGWGTPLNQDLWSASGGTVTLDPSFKFEYGDQFRIEYW
jgi:hypothetical protein